MASKKLGRFRQWAGEVMSSKDSKMFVSEGFQAAVEEIEVRKEGISKIQNISEAYQRSLSKKKIYEPLGNDEKLLPLDALGVVMINNGEQFGEDTPFGASLVKFGRAHCKVATLQEAYAVTFKDTFITSLQGFGDRIKDFEHLKKKLESRRSAYESAYGKAEKLRQGKKEEQKMEAEEELDRAKQRYDETAEDIRALTEAIRGDDAFHLRELTDFLDLEINFAQQYLEVLKDVKSEWSYDRSSTNYQGRNSKSPSSFSLPHQPSSNNARKSPIIPPTGSSSDSSPDDNNNNSTNSRPKSKRRTSSFRRDRAGSGATAGSRTPSRPSSRLSRKRTNSNATATSEKDKDKESITEKASRRLGVAGWASSAVESVTNRRKVGNKERGDFSTLDDDDDDGEVVDYERASTGRRSLEKGSSSSAPLKKSTSVGSLGRGKSSKKSFWSSSSPKVPLVQAAVKPSTPNGERKVVRARFDFEGKSSSELSFKAGEEILVLNEVLDAWWMGELRGQRGLFPTTYIEVVRPSKMSVILPFAQTEKTELIPPPSITRDDAQSFDDGYGTSELDEERDLTSRPLDHHHSPFMQGPGDTQSIVSQITTDDESDLDPQPHTPKQNPRALDPLIDKDKEPGLLSGFLGRATLQAPQAIIQTASSPIAQQTSPAKKIPPPPPPRRAISALPAVAPPLPERRTNTPGGGKSSADPRGYTHTGSSSVSSVSSLGSWTNTDGSGSGEGTEGYDRSPFESVSDLAGEDQGGRREQQTLGGPSGGGVGGASSNKKNPFRKPW